MSGDLLRGVSPLQASKKQREFYSTIAPHVNEMIGPNMQCLCWRACVWSWVVGVGGRADLPVRIVPLPHGHLIRAWPTLALESMITWEPLQHRTLIDLGTSMAMPSSGLRGPRCVGLIRLSLATDHAPVTHMLLR